MLTLEAIGRVGGADKFRLFNPDDGYDKTFIVTDAQRASDAKATEHEIMRQVEKYRNSRRVN